MITGLVILTCNMEVWHKFTSFIFLLLCCSALTEAAGYMKYKDPKVPIKARIEDLLGRMTLAEKIGQMSQIERLNATSDVLKKYFIGKIS